jgi:hypothetical protein
MADWPADQPPWTRSEIRDACWRRPPSARQAVPVPGEALLFRREEWGPEVPASVTAVHAEAADVHVWEHPDPHIPPASWGHPAVRAELRMRADPWPQVTLLLESGATAICRESRVRGAPGWLRPGGGAWMSEEAP